MRGPLIATLPSPAIRRRQEKRRLADEYDAAQGRGEVASQYDGCVGLTSKYVHEASIIRDAEQADPGIVRRALRAALKRSGPVPFGGVGQQVPGLTGGACWGRRRLANICANANVGEACE